MCSSVKTFSKVVHSGRTVVKLGWQTGGKLQVLPTKLGRYCLYSTNSSANRRCTGIEFQKQKAKHKYPQQQTKIHWRAYSELKSADEVREREPEVDMERNGWNEEEAQEEEKDGGFDMVKLTPLQRAIITVGSGLSAFLDPTRAENIATFGEISAGPVLRRLREKMLMDPEGSRILKQKPRINSKTVDLDYLASLPDGTLGHAYIQFLRKNEVTPDSRLPVRFIEDPELAYVMQRYREVHDLVHTVTCQPTNILGEVLVKWIEGIQTGLPMCVTGGVFGATRLYPKQRQRYLDTHLKWAIEVGFTAKPFLFLYYEERWEQDLKDLQFYICPKLLTPPSTKNKSNKQPVS